MVKGGYKLMEPITYRPIGIIHSPFGDPVGMPIQPVGALGVRGRVVVFPEFTAGLKDLQEFSHIHLIYHFHLSQGFELEVKPFLDPQKRGLFATRAPRRPNAIGLSVVRLTGIEGSTLSIEDVDILDGTPLLDIKPYVPAIDSREVDKAGWLNDRSGDLATARADDRFRS
jgi:tRNA (adenine37-N6)-methyltransferase